MICLRLLFLSTAIAFLAFNDESQAASLCKVTSCCCTSIVKTETAAGQNPAYNPGAPAEIAPPPYQPLPGYNSVYPETVAPPTYQQYPSYYSQPTQDLASQSYYQQYAPQQFAQPIYAPIAQTLSGSVAAVPEVPQSSESSSETDSEGIAEQDAEENSEENAISNGPERSSRILALPNQQNQITRASTVSKGYPQPEANANVQGYVTYPGVGTYKVHKYGSAWYDGLARCASEGATLAVASSQQQANTLKSLFNPDERSPGAVDDNRFWVGIQERGTQGQFYTVFGERLENSGYSAWSVGQPNEPGKIDCVSISSDGTYFDDECSLKLAFVCEKIGS